MLSVFDTFRATAKLYEDFKFYDEQERLRKIKMRGHEVPIETKPFKKKQDSPKLQKLTSNEIFAGKALPNTDEGFYDAMPLAYATPAPIGALPFGPDPSESYQKSKAWSKPKIFQPHP